MGRIQSWSCWFLPLTLPIFMHFLPYTFSIMHLCLRSWFYSSVLNPCLLSKAHFVKILMFSSLCCHQTQLLVCNPLPTAGWFISLDISVPAWPHLLSSQTGPFLCCILPRHFPRFFGAVFLYLTLLCLRYLTLLRMMACYSYLYKTMVIPHKDKQK